MLIVNYCIPYESWTRDHNERPPLARSVSLIKSYKNQREVLKRT